MRVLREEVERNVLVEGSSTTSVVGDLHWIVRKAKHRLGQGRTGCLRAGNGAP